MIHLDTSFLIDALVRGSAEDRALRNWLKGGTQLGMSAIAWAEFLCGPVGEGQVQLALKVVTEPAPFVAEDSAEAARLFNLSGRRRGSFVDCMIAAAALRADAGLATSNVADYAKLKQAAGLQLVDLGPQAKR